MTPRRIFLAAAGATLLALQGCDDASGTACTLIGCSDALVVEVRGTTSSPPTIRVTEPGGETRTRICERFASDACSATFADFAPQEVTIAVAIGTQQVSVTVRPAYDILQPNGPDCPPTCRQATVIVELGATSEPQ